MQRTEYDFPSARAGRVDSNERLLWVLIVVLAGAIGAILYCIMVMRPYARPLRAGSGTPPASNG
ncbi:MAG: hypothetical protein WBJ62_00045 [Coriobacteriia bacterium]